MLRGALPTARLWSQGARRGVGGMTGLNSIVVIELYAASSSLCSEMGTVLAQATLMNHARACVCVLLLEQGAQVVCV